MANAAERLLHAAGASMLLYLGLLWGGRTATTAVVAGLVRHLGLTFVPGGALDENLDDGDARGRCSPCWGCRISLRHVFHG